MERTIDTMTLERAIVRHCAPTLAALKPASLFTVPGSFLAEEGAAGRRAALVRAVDGCAEQIARAGLAIRVLAWRECGALVYVYRPGALASYLSDSRAARPLARLGYDVGSLEACLRLLSDRLSAARAHRAPARDEPGPCPCSRMACAREFPHEMGFFLGYPYADVTGFIEHEGRDYLAVGPWKVYADRERALTTFERFRRCSAAYLRASRRGVRLARLAIPSR